MKRTIFTLMLLATQLGIANPDSTADQRLRQVLADSVVGKVIKNTDGLVVMWGPHVVLEKYQNGYQRETSHPTWSVSKSVTSILAGLAIQEKKLSLDESVCKYLHAKSTSHCKIQVRHLLQFNSGQLWQETYENESPRFSSVLAMLYGEGARDMGVFSWQHDLVAEPATRWDYTSGGPNTLMKVLKVALGTSYDTYPWKRLFEPLGIKSAVWERDHAGVFVGSSYLHMTPRDLAKIGRLYLQKGKIGPRSLLNESYINWSLEPNPAQKNDKSQVNGYLSGAMWWLNLPLHGQQRPFSYLPEDTFMALGHWGQYLFVIPSYNLVIARLGNDRDDSTQNVEDLVRQILEVFRGKH